MWAVSGNNVLAYSMYPYPLDGALDQELLAAHALIHSFKDWPGAWPTFMGGWRAVVSGYSNTLQNLYAVMMRGIQMDSSWILGLDSKERSQYLMHRSLIDALK